MFLLTFLSTTIILVASQECEPNTRPNVCTLPPMACQTRYFYNTTSKLCESFQFPIGGPFCTLLDNTNCYTSEDNCIETCVTCPSLDIQNGEISYSNFVKVNSVATYNCDDGFAIASGDSERTCGGDGAWTGEAPVCASCNLHCANDGVCVINPSTGDEECDCPGQFFGRTCLQNMKCQQRPIIIRPFPCPPPPRTCPETRVYFYNRNSNLCEFRDFRNVGNVRCPLSRPENCFLSEEECKQTCAICETFNPCDNGGVCSVTNYNYLCNCSQCYEGQDCQNVKDCGDLSAPPNGSVSAPITTCPNSATYSCNEGYVITSGDSVRTCNGDSWSGTEPTCSLTCPELVAPENGQVVYDNIQRLVESRAEFQCNENYIKTAGDSERICQTNGEWSDGGQVICTITCPELDIPENSDVVYSIEARILGTIATYDCPRKFCLFDGDEERICQEDGSWSGTAPTCQSRNLFKGKSNKGGRKKCKRSKSSKSRSRSSHTRTKSEKKGTDSSGKKKKHS